jgi:putative membrane protein
MQFLKGLIWFLVAVLVAAFVFGNWDEIAKVHLWNDLVADVKLPILVLICFLAGLVPMLVYHHAVRWRLKQRLAAAERSLEAVRQTVAVPTPSSEAAEATPAPPASVDAPPLMPPGSA